MNRSIKWIVTIAFALLLCAALSGCMNIGNRGTEGTSTPAPDGSASPGVMATPDMIESGATAAPMDGASVSPDGSAVGAAPYDWKTNVGAVEQRINMFSEIQESRVVVVGNTALVGVRFTGQYKGEMTARIHDMIAGEVQAADTAVQVVAVTSEQEDVDKINEIADKLQGGTPEAELEQEVDAIVRNATTVQ